MIELHGDVHPLPEMLTKSVDYVSWLSSLLMGDNLNWIERLAIRIERSLAERTARRAMRRRSIGAYATK
jgi:hypothetical protein